MRRSAVVAALAALALTGCAGQDLPSGQGDSSPAAKETAGLGAVDAPAAAGLAGLPSAHVHGVAVNPGDGQVYLATHDGLFIATTQGWRARGPVIDLMGFSVAGSDHFYASGHPGPGTDLPNPVGLIESLDGGATWTPLSRQGQSDFHTLTTTPGGIAGYDGQLRVSPDGTEWSTAEGLSGAAFSLAGGEDGVILATTERGLAISADDGSSWTMAAGAPVLLLVDWAAGETVVGVAPDGTVHVSGDSGRTWEPRGRVGGQPQALGATGAGAELRIVAVIEGSVTESRDAGVTFGELQP